MNQSQEQKTIRLEDNLLRNLELFYCFPKRMLTSILISK